VSVCDVLYILDIYMNCSRDLALSVLKTLNNIQFIIVFTGRLLNSSANSLLTTKDSEINDRLFFAFPRNYIHEIIQEINNNNNNNSRNQYIIHIRCNGFQSHSRMAFRGRQCRSYYRILLFGLEIRVVSRGSIWQVLLGSTVWNALFQLFIIIILICVQHTRITYV